MAILKTFQRSIVTALTGAGLLSTGFIFSPANATQQFFCNGRMNNGWSYTAEYVNGRFTTIRWNRSGQPPQTTNLKFVSTNAKGEPIYRGSFQAAVTVTLVDLSRGNVRPGSEISVTSEEWGWSRATCGTSASGGGGNTGGSGGSASLNINQLRRQLLGMNDKRARQELRRENFSFIQTMEQTRNRVVERWDRGRNSIEVVFTRNSVTDVIKIR